ncbi:MAG: hypothetical protein L3K17_05235 [Thermoplasmata archaeon]|nr:hypothetical protein [Thermoplasmata archaeon]
MNPPEPISAPALPGPDADWLGPILLLGPAGSLAVFSSLGPLAATLLAIAGAGGFAALARWRWARSHGLPGVPALLARAGLAITTSPFPVTELAAGAGALVVLLALGRAGASPSFRASVTTGIGIPFLGLMVAVTTALLLPASHQLIGVAALLAVGAAAVMAILLAEPDRLGESGSPAS